MNPDANTPTRLSNIYDLFVELTGLRDAYEALRDSGGFIDLPIMLRAFAAVFLLLAMTAFCLRAIRMLLPSAGVPLRWSSVCLLGVWIATVGFQLLRAVGIFNLAGALASGAVLAAAALYGLPRRVPLRWVLKREWRAACALERLLFHGRYAIINSVCGLFGALYALRALIVPPLGWDTMTYHGPRAVEWLQSGQFTFDPGPGPLSLYRHFFGGSEVLMAWAMLPFHSDLLVNVAGIAQWLWLGLAIWSLARALGLREPYAASAAGASMFIATVQLELNSGYVEIALNAALMHGIAVAIYGLKRPRGPLCVLAAMALGVAAGIKLPGAPAGVVVLLALCVRLAVSRSTALRSKLRSFAAGLLCAALPVLPWLVFAWRDTGYPLSPMPIEILGYTLGVADPALRWYQAQMLFQPYVFVLERQALTQVFWRLGQPPNEALGSMAIIPILFAPVGALALIWKRPLAGLLVCVSGLISLGIYYSRGMTPIRILWAISASRFLIPVIIFAIVVSLAWCRRGGWFSVAYRRLLLAYPLTYALVTVHYGRGAWETREAVIIGVFVCLVGTAVVGVFRRRGPRWGLFTFVLLFPLCCSFLQLRRDQHRVSAFRESFALHPSPRPWADLLPHIEQAVPRRIAVTAGHYQRADQWFFYPFYGSRLQNEIRYVPPTRDGGIAHYGPEGDIEQRAELSAWEARLKAAGIEYVLTFAPLSLEQRWMDAAPERYQKLGGAHEGGLYMLLR